MGGLRSMRTGFRTGRFSDNQTRFLVKLCQSRAARSQRGGAGVGRHRSGLSAISFHTLANT